jgi:hypothetical protein
MSTTYSGDSSNFPTDITIPSDGDPLNAASVNAALEGLADRTKWVRARAHTFEIAVLVSFGTWTKPANAAMCRFIVVGGGGGGGNASGGGGGGGGGEVLDRTFPASMVPATLDYSVGSGGAEESPGNPTIISGGGIAMQAHGGAAAASNVHGNGGGRGAGTSADPSNIAHHGYAGGGGAGGAGGGSDDLAIGGRGYGGDGGAAGSSAGTRPGKGAKGFGGGGGGRGNSGNGGGGGGSLGVGSSDGADGTTANGGAGASGVLIIVTTYQEGA